MYRLTGFWLICVEIERIFEMSFGSEVEGIFYKVFYEIIWVSNCLLCYKIEVKFWLSKIFSLLFRENTVIFSRFSWQLVNYIFCNLK